jgi:hypothetical protein
MDFKFKQVDRGWTKLTQLVDSLKNGEAYVKAGVLSGGENRLTRAEHASTAATNRDANGRFLKGSGAKTKSTVEGSGADTVMIAAIQEFGVPEKGIPERSFIRAPFAAHKTECVGLLKIEIKKAYEGRGDIPKALDRLGLKMVSFMRTAIKFSSGGNEPYPPNAPSTIEKKGSSRPLVDTGQLLRSITHEVVSK